MAVHVLLKSWWVLALTSRQQTQTVARPLFAPQLSQEMPQGLCIYWRAAQTPSGNATTVLRISTLLCLG
jgi:hypothetical protein